jgi:hypothetical protein
MRPILLRCVALRCAALRSRQCSAPLRAALEHRVVAQLGIALHCSALPGLLEFSAIDILHNTPVLDIKPCVRPWLLAAQPWFGVPRWRGGCMQCWWGDTVGFGRSCAWLALRSVGRAPPACAPATRSRRSRRHAMQHSAIKHRARSTPAERSRGQRSVLGSVPARKPAHVPTTA